MNNFTIVRNLMIKDNYLDSVICEFEAENKRDMTEEEENKIILDMLQECQERMQDISCNITEAYNDIMH